MTDQTTKPINGRPTVMTTEAVTKLEYAFSLGCTDLEACFHADISKTALYDYCVKHPEFAERKERLKGNPVFLARGVIIDALKQNDVATANKVIERKDGTKNIVEGGENPIKQKWSVEFINATPTESTD